MSPHKKWRSQEPATSGSSDVLYLSWRDGAGVIHILPDRGLAAESEDRFRGSGWEILYVCSCVGMLGVCLWVKMSAATRHVRLKVIGCLLKRLSNLGATFTVCGFPADCRIPSSLAYSLCRSSHWQGKQKENVYLSSLMMKVPDHVCLRLDLYRV
jgi:hypothetical protein